MNDHQIVWETENASPAFVEHWEAWVARAEKLAGHDLDGDEETDGYSLGFAYDAYLAGKTAAQYVRGFKSPK